MMSLERLCLSQIAESIGRYSHVYSTTNDEELQRRFHFLQRFYTPELLSLLTDKGLLKECHADLVLNKYLKSLDMQLLFSFTGMKILETLTRIGSDIEEVIFSGHFQTAWKAIMHLLPNVKSVTYTECCNDDVLRSIAQHCPKLEMLNVNFSRNVTDDGIAHFLPVVKRKRRRKIGWCPTGREYLPCPLLTKIHLQYTDVSVGGIITLLEKLPLLEILDSLELPMVLQRIYKEQLFTPRKLNLTHLSLSFHTRNYYDSYEDIFKACVILCPNLKTVSLSVNKLKQLDLCFLLPDATDLDLCFCSRHSTTAGLNDFLKSQGRKITRLTFLHGTTVPLSVLVQYCRRLKELRMEGVSVECDGNGSTETFNNLKVFSVQLNDLWNSSNCEAICRVLESSPVLEKLLLELNTFPAQLKNAILKCCAQAPLRCIDLHEIGNDKKFIRNVLSTCSTLRTFVLYGNNICSS